MCVLPRSFIVMVAWALTAQADELISIESLLNKMVDREVVARFPQVHFRLKQHSSYNRASTTPNDPKGWFTNHDYNSGDSDKNFIRIEEVNGQTEWVLMDHQGPGAIVRTWMPWRNQQSAETTTVMRIYLDGAEEPTLEGNMLGLFDGTGLIPYPLAHSSLRSAVSFFPIPYAKSCKVTTTERPFFFQFTFREYPEGTPVKTFTMADFKAAKGLAKKVGDSLLNPQNSRTGKRLGFKATLKKMEEKSLDLPAASAAVRTLSVKLDNYADPTVTRSVVLRMEFDGRETVWSPVGDFFGTGIGLHPFQGWYRTVAEDGTMSCRWVMPYQQSGRISVVNLGDKPLDIQLNGVVGNWNWDERSMYFNAAWRGEYPVPTHPYSDWNYVTLKGRGVYVGDTLTIMNPVERWWGEGDEKIWIDGEGFPSIFGTGTEDYYAYSWGGRSTDFYEHPFHAQVRCHQYNKLNRKRNPDERNTLGYSTETRTRSLDTMPFGRSLQLDMEVWSGTDCDMGYGVGMYWYDDGATTSNRKPDPGGALAVPPFPNMPALRSLGEGGSASTSVPVSAEPFQKAEFYVSPEGSDDWSGSLHEPNAQASDGPFATLGRARDAVRDLKKRTSKDIVVLVRAGTYQLKTTVVFGLEDSGEGDSTITYAAYPGEKPVFSSGQEITGWKKVSGKLPGLPKEAGGNIWVANVSGRFFTLYDAKGLLPRARSAGFIPLDGGSRNRLHFPEGRLKNWPNMEDVEIVVRPHHAWIVNLLPLVSVDEDKQMAHTSIDATYAMNRLHFLKETDSCWVENALEGLDEPGEWALNTKEGKVYLWPRGTSPPRGIMAPQLTELIRIEGKIDKMGPKDVPVRNLCFRSLTFMHGERYQLTRDDAGLQHDWDMLDKANALVRLRGTENCTIEQCHFAHSGSGAIRVDLHGQWNKISGNRIEHMGGAGILLCGYGPGTKDVNKNNLVYNNHIHHTGRIYSHSPGIMVWQSGENRVANNLVHHTPYTGIIISGCMTDFFRRNGRELGRTIRRHEIGELPKKPELEDVRPYLHTHDNLIEYNEIHHAMEMLGDGNAIYIRGAGGGNVIRRNYVHHLVAPMIMQCAIRTDGGQRDTLIAENLIYKCVSQGIMLKLNTRVENNIVADIIAPPRGYYLAVREGPLTGAAIKRNIFYSFSKECVFIDELPPGTGRTNEDRRGRKLAKAKDANTDYNIYYCAADPELGKTMLEKQQGDGVDTHSKAVDPENGDFRFKPGSPALKMGIVPIDLSKVGLLSTNE